MRRERKHRRRLLRWLWDRSPDWWPDWFLDPLTKLTAWVGCRVSHAPYVEMDRTSVVCLYCHHLLGELPNTCPFCGQTVLGDERPHMETRHPEVIARRLREGGFRKLADGTIVDLLADPEGR